jgi:NAD(P)-dependent dehydrogenase (short-subunit alcohol dehydrogenase family)
MAPKADHGETSYLGHGRLRGRKALVTGGDSGIGRAAAIAFAREGADVAINYLPSEEADAKEVVALIEQEGRLAVAIPGNISNEKFCVKLVNQAHKKLGGLDILAAVAGRQHAVDRIADLTTKQNGRHLSRECVRTFLALQSRPSPHAGRGLDHYHRVDPGDPSKSKPFGLCADQSCNFGVH